MSARPVTLVISNIAWDFVWQRHQTLASFFARDSDVVFVEVLGIRRVGWRDSSRVWMRLRSLWGRTPSSVQREPVPGGVRVVRFFLFPATNIFFQAINARLVARWLKREPSINAGVGTIMNYSPSHTALQIIARVSHRHLVYDCTDDWLAVTGIPACLPIDERTLLANADLTLVPSRALEERKGPAARRIVRVPHGALVERFLMNPKPTPTDGKLTVLYYGHLHAQHLDFGAIESLARARPDWRVLLIGPAKTPYVFPPNVEVVGQQAHEGLRVYAARADVLLLPYVLNDYTRAVLPAKIYECLATGRPIVATPLPELMADFSAQLEFAAGLEWPEKIEVALATNTPAASAARIALAQANSWERRYEEICALIETAQ